MVIQIRPLQWADSWGKQNHAADVQKPDVTNVGAVKPQATKTAANESRKTKTPVTVVKECEPFRIGIEGIRTAFIREFGARRYFFMR
ncbi:hypothetical protein [Paraburkholderia sp. MM5384-R2]|uniref:hypothetical protein n=1 Tax=Paraburkholderia sp. MM5384-R2 TaxID=2723097 RepID=UPI001613A2BA|nr:hypothetical protein [Paraburkholderia sp. MM5384-R2]MBB5497838.1 hypothetical protein [Paraburkholderia sp. MM5384-R2]